jgi:uncharacterized protein
VKFTLHVSRPNPGNADRAERRRSRIRPSCPPDLNVSTLSLIVLILLFFATSVVGVVTGSNSLITVPVMFQFGVDEKVAVATNMFGLMFMAVGGSIPFIRSGKLDYRRVWPLVALTVVSSAIGAALVGLITNQSIKLIVTVAMIAVSVFIVIYRNSASDASVSRQSAVLTFVLVFLLGIYGGLYSGGYVTILTAVLVAFFGMKYLESIASTKIINVFSSFIATLVFMWQGLVDYKLGLILGISMFTGAYVGAHYAVKMNETWLRRIFLTTVLVLAAKAAWDLI